MKTLFKEADSLYMPQLIKQTIEAENVLRYTLQLPLDDIETPEPPIFPSTNSNAETHSEFSNVLANFFDNIGESIYNNCGYLFNYHNANVFGCKTDNVNDLSMLSTKNIFWQHIFTQDMILSLYDKLRKLIGANYSLKICSFTKLINYTISESSYINTKYHGFDYLTGCADIIPQNCVELKGDANNNIITDKITPVLSKEDWCRHAGNIRSRLIDKSNQLEDYFNFQCLIPDIPIPESESDSAQKDIIDKAPSLYLNALELYQLILTPRDSNNVTFKTGINPVINSHKESKAFRSSDYKKYIHCISHLLSQSKIEDLDKNINYVPEENIPEHNLALSDKIYLRYQIEKVFAPMMIDCMYRNINLTANTFNALNDQATINRLSSCFTLPNVFTRHYIFQMAVDTLTKHSENGFDDSYFFSKYVSAPTAIVTKIHDSVDPFRSHKAVSVWLNRYESFVNYLAHMLLPIYENIFFIKIWHCIRAKYPDRNEAECIVYLYKLLSQYLNNTDCVQKLFSTEETFWKVGKDLRQSNPKLKPEHILRPSFIPDKDINTKLYHQCILSQKITSKQEPIPEFLNLKYLNQYAPSPNENIQSFYIRSFMN